MAEREQDREDLLAEAKALTQRISLLVPGDDEATVVGFRRDDSASFYFGTSRAYQFTSAGQLRRAFVGGLLFKAEGGKVVALRRERKTSVVELVSRELDVDAERDFLEEMRSRLDKLKDALASGNPAVIGQVPKDADVMGRARDWLERFAAAVTIARSPRAC
jgi:hypothetical protein